jgi:oxygen-independent coproporphyrinogen-3 oxidase
MTTQTPTESPLQDKSLAIYVHWPFCRKKCPYCDFNSHVRDGVDHAAWRVALLRELRYWRERVDGHTVTSIFFGGGTPSLMQPETVAAIIAEVKALWPSTPSPLAGEGWDGGEVTHGAKAATPPPPNLPPQGGEEVYEIEITLEANPTSVEAANFSALAQAGVNRVSLGLQSLRAEALRFLGREHSAREALDAVALAANTFPRYSFDLIYALPGQTLTGWEAELREALQYARGHLSLYQLTIEPNTAFHHQYHVQHAFALPVDDLAADLYAITQRIMGEHGMPAYETSNHAAPGQESRHNLSYWRSQAYLGIGPGAHGRVDFPSSWKGEAGRGTSAAQRASFVPASPPPNLPLPGGGKRHATSTLKSPERWLEQVQKLGHGIEQDLPLTDRERLEERVLMGLRLPHEGISDVPPEILQKAKPLIAEGLLVYERERLRPTPSGMLVLNAITASLLTS